MDAQDEKTPDEESRNGSGTEVTDGGKAEGQHSPGDDASGDVEVVGLELPRPSAGDSDAEDVLKLMRIGRKYDLDPHDVVDDGALNDLEVCVNAQGWTGDEVEEVQRDYSPELHLCGVRAFPFEGLYRVDWRCQAF